MQRGSIITYEDGSKDRVVGIDFLGSVEILVLEPLAWRHNSEKWKSRRVVEQMISAGKWQVERVRRERVRL